MRVTKGKGILVSGGVFNEADLRAPRDVANLCVSTSRAFFRISYLVLIGGVNLTGSRCSASHKTSHMMPQQK